MIFITRISIEKRMISLKCYIKPNFLNMYIAVATSNKTKNEAPTKNTISPLVKSTKALSFAMFARKIWIINR